MRYFSASHVSISFRSFSLNLTACVLRARTPAWQKRRRSERGSRTVDASCKILQRDLDHRMHELCHLMFAEKICESVGKVIFARS